MNIQFSIKFFLKVGVTMTAGAKGCAGAEKTAGIKLLPTKFGCAGGPPIAAKA